ncbi:cytochrome aa3 quinol oxidase subunit IV [Shimazuella sp. AN120528]|uniref:cytochrome aa3 quinol oxidase subunit IV n=1 Tax=Shimazuella soli TaxID=1892854 RepID=UPI001F0EF6E5|nr:cytochrome aa3 quinol oxidase subunit IV [Shimazuella soli]MCH5583697.1 cytochrome aa3 quinol oxidase subunit IV [Shimazuella soli]
MEQHHSAKPHIVGYIFSLILTVLAFVDMLYTRLPMSMKITVLLILAVLQFLVQLIYFMHIWESKERAYQVISIAYGIFVAISIVAGSIWIMIYNTMPM